MTKFTEAELEVLMESPIQKMCAHCFADEFHLLARPQRLAASEEFGDIRFKHRKYMVPSGCSRCPPERGYRRSVGILAYLNCVRQGPADDDLFCAMDVFMPIHVVADTRIMNRKHAASVIVKKQPANQLLQMISLCGMAEDPLVRDAYASVGLACILDEMTFAQGDISLRSYVTERWAWTKRIISVPDTERINTGTTWRTVTCEEVSSLAVQYSQPPPKADSSEDKPGKEEEPGDDEEGKDAPKGDTPKIEYSKAVLKAATALAKELDVPFYKGHEHDQKLVGKKVKHVHICTACRITPFDHEHSVKTKAESEKYPQLCKACASAEAVRKREHKPSTATKAKVPDDAANPFAMGPKPVDEPLKPMSPHEVELASAVSEHKAHLRTGSQARMLKFQLGADESRLQTMERTNSPGTKSRMGIATLSELAVLKENGVTASDVAAVEKVARVRALMVKSRINTLEQLKPSPIVATALAVAAVKTTGNEICDIAAKLPGAKAPVVTEPAGASTPAPSGGLNGKGTVSDSPDQQSGAEVADKSSHPSTSSNLAAAELETEIDRLQGGYVNGEVVESHVVHVQPNPEHASCKEKNLPRPEAAQTGVKTAQARSPQLTKEKVNLHSKDARNLHAANTLRNVNIGHHAPTPDEAEKLQLLKDILCKKLFSKKNCDHALKEFTDIKQTCFPSKLSAAEKDKWMDGALNEAEGSSLSYVRALTYSRTIEAFVKTEVTAGNKPRPIANHKEIRLVALAKVAWVFDHVMFEHLELMSIKHRGKRNVIEQMATFMDEAFSTRGSKDYARFVENDFSAFEFGIGEVLKKFESDILMHIATVIGYSAADLEVSGLLFERVLADRTRACTWKMTCKDEAGATFTYRFEQKRPMRESGDRLTSSGNFLQNLAAWTVYLVEKSSLDAAVDSMLLYQGKKFFYTSARDSKQYVACLYFEGDDTIGRLEELAVWTPHYREDKFMIDGVLETRSVSMLDVEWFFKRWGFRSKCDFKTTTGYDFYRFVGYDTLIKDNKPVFVGGGRNRRLVMQPDMKRILTTKTWTVQMGTPAQIRFATGVYATTFGSEFCHNDVAHAYFKAMWEASALTHDQADEVRERTYDHHMTDMVLRVTGNMALEKESQKTVNFWLKNEDFPELQPSIAEDKILSRLAIGPFTDREWAEGSSMMGFEVHGEDLAGNLPASWVRC